MVTEPEIAIPLAYYTPHQVTLFGDDKQQAPAVNNERAAKLGLGTSLFSRYISKAIKLTKQFRMVGSTIYIYLCRLQIYLGILIPLYTLVI